MDAERFRLLFTILPQVEKRPRQHSEWRVFEVIEQILSLEKRLC